MELTRQYEAVEASVELRDDYDVLLAEARSQVRTLTAMIVGTQTELDNVAERDPPEALREAALTNTLRRLYDLRSVWESRVAVYAFYTRVVARRRDELVGAT